MHPFRFRRPAPAAALRLPLIGGLLGLCVALAACDELLEPTPPASVAGASVTSTGVAPGVQSTPFVTRPGAGTQPAASTQRPSPSQAPPSQAPSTSGSSESPDWDDPFALLSAAERELYDLLMAYRAEHDLPALPFSPALTTVAQVHVADLKAHGDEALAGDCNLHSWSIHGDWTPCCYTPDHAQAACMWNKPRELTHYTGNGYEISVWATSLSPRGALQSWQGSPGHNDVILNRDIWTEPWAAVGVGLGERYGHVWFGRAVDPMSAPPP